jgi:hypothetical protein
VLGFDVVGLFVGCTRGACVCPVGDSVAKIAHRGSESPRQNVAQSKVVSSDEFSTTRERLVRAQTEIYASMKTRRVSSVAGKARGACREEREPTGHQGGAGCCAEQ